MLKLKKKPKIIFLKSSEKIGIINYQKFCKFMLMAGDVGSDFEDFDKHFQKINQFIKSGLKMEATRELDNFRSSIFNALNNESPKNNALACLVESINGKPVARLDTEEIKRIMKALDDAGFTKEKRDELTSEVKKK